MILTRYTPQFLKRVQRVKKGGGFTLIEMLVVVCIIVLMSFMVMPSVSSYFQLSLNSATRDLASKIKESYNAAVVTGKVHRLAYSLKENNFWVEIGPSNALMDTKESLEKDARKKKYALHPDAANESEFAIEKALTRKKQNLPRGVIFEDILTQQSPEPITEGVVYTHFFPYGMTEQTLIHLKDNSNHHATLSISSLIGITEVYDRYVSAKELLEKR
jgi:Tfp pilus assembly protein FimT